MTYSCTDFTDSILEALKIEVPEEAWDSPVDQAELALAEIARLQRSEGALRKRAGKRPIKVWVLSTCIPDDNEPCLPHVFGSQAEADAAFEKAMREEWEVNAPEDDAGQKLPWPGNATEAHDQLAEANVTWGWWQITCHTVEILEESAS